MSDTTYILYADGSCLENHTPGGGPGGWAYQLFFEVHSEDAMVLSGAGSHPSTTNNVMEVRALVSALRDMVEDGIGNCRLLLRLDSNYALNTVFEWMPGYKSRGWRKSDKKPIANLELIQELDAAVIAAQAAGIVLVRDKVKGHSGEAGNETVDKIAAKMSASALDDRGDEADAHAAPFPAMTGPGDVTQMQELLMQTILDMHRKGESSVCDVVRHIRENAQALGIAR